MIKRKIKRKKTKVIATIGPASNTVTMIKSMISSGVDVFRINASHQSNPDEVKTMVSDIRMASIELSRWVSIFLDLQGPKIRIGTFKHPNVTLKRGESFTLVADSIEGNQEQCSTSYPQLISDCNVGDIILIDDGKIKLIVEKKEASQLICNVLNGGVISSKKGLNLPNTELNISPITSKDRRDILTAIANQLDYVALSFVNSADDVKQLRSILDDNGGTNIRIISKIERPQAMNNLKEIIEQSDAVMVARGDLGVEIGLENVPSAQKQIIYECNQLMKPVIVATQMLETLIDKRTATRAEVSDIANAIYDHCDAVMLSAETATGIDPENAVSIMRDICFATDTRMVDIKKRDPSYYKFVFSLPVQTMATSFVKAADQIAEENNANAIMTFTSTGQTPLIASKLNPGIPILGVTDNEVTMRRLALYRGVIPIMLPEKFANIHRWRDMIRSGIDTAKSLGVLAVGDTLVITAGIPINKAGGINSIRLQVVA